ITDITFLKLNSSFKQCFIVHMDIDVSVLMETECRQVMIKYYFSISVYPYVFNSIRVGRTIHFVKYFNLKTDIAPGGYFGWDSIIGTYFCCFKFKPAKFLVYS